MAIARYQTRDGAERFSVRVKRYGQRVTLGRFDSVYAAIHVETEAYKKYLERVWIHGEEKSKRENSYSSNTERRRASDACKKLGQQKQAGLQTGGK